MTASLKINLKLSIQRLKLLQAKKSSINQNARTEISNLLSAGKEESARIRVEHIIREDFLVEAMEIIELYSELILGRYAMLENTRHIDPSLIEAVMTIIYAAPRLEVKELVAARNEFIKQFGKDLAMDAMSNRNENVNSRIIHKLSIQAPDPFLVEQYLKVIAKSYNIAWEPSERREREKTSPRPDLCLIDTSLPIDRQHGLEDTQLPPESSCNDCMNSSSLSDIHRPSPPFSHSQISQFTNNEQTFIPPPSGFSMYSNAHYYSTQPPQYLNQDADNIPPPPSHLPPPPPSSIISPSFSNHNEKTDFRNDMNVASSDQSLSSNVSNPSANLPDFDDLTRRFEALKKRQ